MQIKIHDDIQICHEIEKTEEVSSNLQNHYPQRIDRTPVVAQWLPLAYLDMQQYYKHYKIPFPFRRHNKSKVICLSSAVATFS